jgi:aminopeptidase N
VSPSDWSYLWQVLRTLFNQAITDFGISRLNEGFATLYERILNDIDFLDETYIEDFFTRDLMVYSDSQGLLNPLNLYAESPAEIREKFDTEIYQKAAVILRMIKDAIGEEVFVQGVKYYLDEMQFKSASPSDLYAGLQKAIDEASPGNSVNMDQFMDFWTNYRGLPVVLVNRSENGLLLTQNGVGTDGDVEFSIPISYATASDRNFDDVKAEFWMTTKQHELTRETAGKTFTDDDWVILNLRDTGYYLTNYDDNLWELITAALADPEHHEDIHFLNRGTLFADTIRLIEQAVDFRATVLLELMDSLKLEEHAHVWIRAFFGLGTFERRLRGTDSHALYLSFLKNLMTEIYGRTIETFGGLVTEVINHFSCLSGVQACTDDAMKALMEVMENGRTNYPFLYRCSAFRVANESVWMHFFNEAVAMRNQELQYRALGELACTKNPTLIQHLLNATIDMTNLIHRSNRDDIFGILAGHHFEGFSAAIEFIEENHVAIRMR